MKPRLICFSLPQLLPLRNSHLLGYFHGYVTHLPWPIWSSALTSFSNLKLRFTEESRAIIFRMAREHLKARRHYDFGCYKDENEICLGCRYLLSAWIDALERISNRSALHSALHSYQGYSKQHLCGECSDQCVYFQAVVKILKNGFDSTPLLTHFLHPHHK